MTIRSRAGSWLFRLLSGTNTHWSEETRKYGRRTTRATTRLSVESLEDRTLLSVISVASELTAGQLNVTGSGFGDTIDVREVSDTVYVKYATELSGQLVADGTFSYAASVVQSVNIYGIGGNNTIRVTNPDGAASFTVYIDGGPGNNDIQVQNLSATLIGGTGNDSLFAQGGNVTLDYSNAPAAISVDLLNHVASLDGYGTQTVLQGIENVVGSSFNDVIRGDNAPDILRAGAGNETIFAGAGNTTIYGGAGTDRLVAGTGTDVIYGGSGDTTFVPGGGNDTMVGGSGSNTVDFSLAVKTDGNTSVPGVTIDLVHGIATGYGTVRLVNIQNAIGSDGNDTFYLTSANKVNGGLGVDQFYINGTKVDFSSVDPTQPNQMVALFQQYGNNIQDLFEQTWNQLQADLMPDRAGLSASQQLSFDQSFGQMYSSMLNTSSDGLYLANPSQGLALDGNPFDTTPFDYNTYVSTGSQIVTGVSNALSGIANEIGVFAVNVIQSVATAVINFGQNIGNSIVNFAINIGTVFQDPRADVEFARFVGAFGVLGRNLVFNSTASFVVDLVSNVLGQFFGQISGRPLSDAEKNLTNAIFGDQIPTWRVRIVPESGWVDTLNNLGASLNGQTNGSVIFLATPPDLQQFSYTDGGGNRQTAVLDSNVLGPQLISTFVHEMTHIFQKYNEFRSVSGQALGEAIGGTEIIDLRVGTSNVLDTPPVDTHSQYAVQLTNDTHWSDLGLEQQAKAVETFYGFIELVGALEAAYRRSQENHTTFVNEIKNIDPTSIPDSVGPGDLLGSLYSNTQAYVDSFNAAQKRSNGFPDFPAWDNYYRIMKEAFLFVGNPLDILDMQGKFSWPGFTNGGYNFLNQPLGLTDGSSSGSTGFRVISYDLAAGTVTFADDQGGTTANSLKLWEVNGYLASNATNGNYADPSDIDPGLGVAQIKVSSATAITIFADNEGDVVDASGVVDNGVTIVGGPGTETLIGSSAPSPLGDAIYAGSGNDLIEGMGGTDLLVGGAGKDTIISGTGDAIIQGGTGNDLIETGTGLNEVDGSSGDNTLVFTGNTGDYLLSTFFNNTVLLGAGDGSSTGLFGAANIGRVIVNGSPMDDKFLVRATKKGTDVTVNGKGGSDTFDINSDAARRADGTLNYAGDLAGIQGVLTLQGGSGPGNVLTIGDVSGKVDVWNITARNSGNINTNVFHFSGVQNLTGGAESDVFHFAPGSSIIGEIDGGGGTNWLDYSALPSNMVVNLATGPIPLITGGVTNIHNVIGSAVGGDTLTGDASGGVLLAHNGGNTLNAGIRPSVLIGGYGLNLLFGGPSDDLIINGSTYYDSNITALSAILGIWQGPGMYSDRVMAPEMPGVDQLIWGRTVFTYPGKNGGIGPRFGRGGFLYESTILGNGGQDFFYTNSVRTIVDLQANEQVRAVDPPVTLADNVINTDMPVLTWTAVNGADHYDLWIDDESTHTSQVVRVRQVATPFYALSAAQALTPGHIYMWWAGSVTTAGVTTWGPGAPLTVAALAAPAVSAPTALSATDTPTFAWNAVNGAAHYDLWVNDTTTGTSQALRLPSLTATSVTLSSGQALNPGDQYIWWIGAVSTNGLATTWSSPQYLTIVPLAAPMVSAPAAFSATDTPTFTWNAVNNSAHYDLWVNDTTSGTSQVLRLPSLTGTTVTLTSAQALSPGDQYVWWIGSVSTNGQVTAWSSPQSLTIAALAAPVPISVAGVSSSAPTFAWSAVALADHYDVWVDDVTSGTSKVLRDKKVAGTSWIGEALTAGHQYRWWVRAISSDDTASFWSAAIDVVAV